jgi:prevent-host-death family protein
MDSLYKMRTIGLFQAKQKLSELVERANSGERIGITRRGKLAAVLTCPEEDVNWEAVIQKMDEVRKRVKKPKGITTSQLIEEGRRR